MAKSTNKNHGTIAKLLHWSTAILLGYGFLTGVNDVSDLTNPEHLKTELIFTFFVAIAFLLRFLWMHKINGHTRLSKEAPEWEHVLSQLAHYGMYIGVASIILSGLAIALAISFFSPTGLFVTLIVGLHEITIGITGVLIGIHVLGAIWHKKKRKDGIWESMLPK